MTVISDNDRDLRSGKVDWLASCVAVLSTWQYACKEVVVEKKGCTQALLRRVAGSLLPHCGNVPMMDSVIN